MLGTSTVEAIFLGKTVKAESMQGTCIETEGGVFSCHFRSQVLQNMCVSELEKLGVLSPEYEDTKCATR